MPKEISDQPAHPRNLSSLRCPHEETVHLWLYKKCPMKILMFIYSDQNLGWAHMSEIMFSDVASQIFKLYFKAYYEKIMNYFLRKEVIAYASNDRLDQPVCLYRPVHLRILIRSFMARLIHKEVLIKVDKKNP